MRKIGVILLLLCTMLTVHAQEYSVKIACPDTVEANAIFRISYKIMSCAPEYSVSITSRFNAINAEVLYGPSTSTQTSYIIDKGVTSKRTYYTYSYVVKAFSKNGEVVIEPMSFDLSKDSLTQMILTAPHKVVIVKEKVKSPMSIQKNDSIIKKNDLIMKWSASSKSVNLGDTIHCVCDLYTKVNITSLDNTPRITLNDCFVLEDSLPKVKEFETVEYNGETYRHLRWAGYRLTPLRAGFFKIGGESFICQVASMCMDPFEALSQGKNPVQETTYENVSEPVVFEVKGKRQTQTLTPNLANSKGKKYLLCDISSSMTSKDFYPNRISIAKDFADNWLHGTKDRGLITFAGVIESVQKSNAVIDTISFPQAPKIDGTALGDAILAALAMDEDVSDIILLTDGVDNAGHFTLRTAIDILMQHNIRLSFVYLNSCKDSVDYTVSDSIVTVKNICLAPKQLCEISKLVESTGGIFAKVTSEEELNDVVSKLQAIISEPRRRTTTKNKYDAKQLKIALQHLTNEQK